MTEVHTALDCDSDTLPVITHRVQYGRQIQYSDTLLSNTYRTSVKGYGGISSVAKKRIHMLSIGWVFSRAIRKVLNWVLWRVECKGGIWTKSASRQSSENRASRFWHVLLSRTGPTYRIEARNMGHWSDRFGHLRFRNREFHLLVSVNMP